MKRLLIFTAAAVAAAVPAITGLAGNASFAQSVPVRVPAQVAAAQAADDNGGQTKHVEPGDDNGGATKHAEPGDDNGGATTHAEPGDDNGGATTHAEPATTTAARPRTPSRATTTAARAAERRERQARRGRRRRAPVTADTSGRRHRADRTGPRGAAARPASRPGSPCPASAGVPGRPTARSGCGGSSRRWSRPWPRSLVVVAVAGAVASRKVAEREAVNDAAQTTDLLAASAVQPALEDALLTGSPAALARLDDAVRTRVLGDAVVRVKIWTPDGRILYSDEPRIIGATFALGEEERQVLENPTTHAEVSDLTARRTSTSRAAGSCSRSTVRSGLRAAGRCCSRPICRTTP